MTIHEAVKKAKHIQRWRQGDERIKKMPDPKEVTEVFDTLIEFCKNHTKSDFQNWKDEETENVKNEKKQFCEDVNLKRHIKNAFNEGYRQGLSDAPANDNTKDIALFTDAENYYNQTFKIE